MLAARAVPAAAVRSLRRAGGWRVEVELLAFLAGTGAAIGMMAGGTTGETYAALIGRRGELLLGRAGTGGGKDVAVGAIVIGIDFRSISLRFVSPAVTTNTGV